MYESSWINHQSKGRVESRLAAQRVAKTSDASATGTAAPLSSGGVVSCSSFPRLALSFHSQGFGRLGLDSHVNPNSLFLSGLLVTPFLKDQFYCPIDPSLSLTHSHTHWLAKPLSSCSSWSLMDGLHLLASLE